MKCLANPASLCLTETCADTDSWFGSLQTYIVDTKQAASGDLVFHRFEDMEV
jgi:hypothetical protein